MPPADRPLIVLLGALIAPGRGVMTRAPLERLRLPAMAVALLFLFVAVLALVTVLRDPYQMDFISYWAAARLGLEGNPAARLRFRRAPRGRAPGDDGRRAALRLPALLHAAGGAVRAGPLSGRRGRLGGPDLRALCRGRPLLGPDFLWLALAHAAGPDQRDHRPGRLPHRGFVRRRRRLAAEAPVRSAGCCSG